MGTTDLEAGPHRLLQASFHQRRVLLRAQVEQVWDQGHKDQIHVLGPSEPGLLQTLNKLLVAFSELTNSTDWGRCQVLTDRYLPGSGQGLLRLAHTHTALGSGPASSGNHSSLRAWPWEGDEATTL